MYWFKELDLIYVVSNNRQLIGRFKDEYTNGSNRDSCPGSHTHQFKPLDGFGRIWCGSSEVRSRLGQPTKDSFTYPQIGTYLSFPSKEEFTVENGATLTLVK